ncbi:MAG: ABC transporter ATP-binding protein [Deltaproteobacteria bacterium]|jgi:peptide/nickel transport system ATP-binding protein/oligopeptide transport system ATP-binding protein|nr:ABC transporter ATP-binding protein [Deltaproteobacteria bacterium]MDH3772850.1 ABC transporter ATP-binding protein [Deltaproteobacteria bacterium]MDH3800525.1 ABC transporter ATP-binding protein [Deltaproteobacteria bacterium]MDH3849562.1 ABC transporter ATP-binding protein [Deltaproteobacteria bacterium]MDH3896419.1 ABC transporter ATP-binding protein [Deltaproteobacteria bacterium]
MGSNDLVLEIQQLQTYFYVRGQVAKAVDEVDLAIASGQTLGLVGESGCGKSVTAHSIIGLIPDPPGKVVGGKILFEGTNLLELPEARMRKIRGNRISMVFQEPMTSLNPVYSVGNQVAEVIKLHQHLSRSETRNRVVEMFQLVGISEAEKCIACYPHQMSGGMRQRAMIAMALACSPTLMIADEPTTALDVTIQAQILALMNKLKEETGASILFITHDLGVIAEMAQHVAVMYAGKVMEYTDVKTLFAEPKHPYTVGLLQSIIVLGRGQRDQKLNAISGVVPSLFNLPSGCLFSDRCPDVFADCRTIEPHMYQVGKNHTARCLKYA